jgi:hypothetical protein
MHACDSPVIVVPQVPLPLHRLSVRVRDCVPDVAHEVLPVQALHAE